MADPILYPADVPEELRTVYLSTVKAARHVQDLEIKRLHAKLAASRAVLADREKELLGLKGPCSNTSCRLHYAHSGPCDIRAAEPA